MKTTSLNLAALVLCVAWLLLGGGDRLILEIIAFRDYAFSRKGRINSDQFVAGNLKSGMTLHEVNNCLSNAVSVSDLFVIKNANGVYYTQFFYFEYGPTWKMTLSSRTKRLCKEEIRVTYDVRTNLLAVKRMYTTGLIVFADNREVTFNARSD